MGPLGGKSRNKARDVRRSRSRNTTPSSVMSIPASVNQADKTAYLEIPLGSLMTPSNITYDDILERHGGTGPIPDTKHLEVLVNDLKTLSELAETRGQACDSGMRELSSRRKERVEEEREREQASREAEEKESLKRAAEDDDDRKGEKVKRRKERSSVREDRPLAHGAHGLARQDGLDASPRAPTVADSVEPPNPQLKHEPASGSSSSLSPPSQTTSPTLATHAQGARSTRPSSSSSSSSSDSHQPPPAPSVPQYQTFGPDPSTFDDPTIYHIREVRDDMTDEEKKEIYCVAQFPHDDLSNLIAGTVPDKDFSNAKPANQVNANTFAAYIEPFCRPLTEEDTAFLKERGDRVRPFLTPARGKRHYTEIWAEEDGAMSLDASPSRDKLPPNQPRGSLEQMDDSVAETDQVSTGPVLSRLLSLMRVGHRPPSDDRPNGVVNGNGDSATNGTTNGDATGDVDMTRDEKVDRLPPATFMPESAQPGWKVPPTKLDYAQVDERLKTELRYIGFLPTDEEPAYDDHMDDEIAERLRILQAELKQQSIINGARKARILQLAETRLAHQEYSSICEDLDSQVQAAYQKRTRTLGKSKKNVKRPGGAGGGSHYVGGAGPANVTKPGIGDQTKTLMEKRKRWMTVISPVFDEEVTKVRGEGESIFRGEDMEPFLQAEKERWDEETAEATEVE